MSGRASDKYEVESEHDARLWLDGELSTQEYVDKAWARVTGRANEIVSREIYGGGRIGQSLRQHYRNASVAVAILFVAATDLFVVLAVLGLSLVGFRLISHLFSIPHSVLWVTFVVWAVVVIVVAYRVGIAAIKGSTLPR